MASLGSGPRQHDQLDRRREHARERLFSGYQRLVAGHLCAHQRARSEQAIGAQLVATPQAVAATLDHQPGPGEAEDEGAVGRGKQADQGLVVGARGAGQGTAMVLAHLGEPRPRTRLPRRDADQRGPGRVGSRAVAVEGNDATLANGEAPAAAAGIEDDAVAIRLPRELSLLLFRASHRGPRTAGSA
jgi:hypothetical protein